MSPVSDAADALRRLLGLIDSLHEPEDLTLARLAQFSGLQAQPDASRPTDFYAFQEITPAWSSSYSLWQERTTKLPSLSFDFSETEAFRNTWPAKTDICTLDMNHFHGALLRMGFAHVGSSRSATPERQYRRGRLNLNVSYTGESSESLAKIEHDCVHRVHAYFMQSEVER